MELEFEEEKIYNITLKMSAGYLEALYLKLMNALEYPSSFWEGKSPSCEVEEFLKKLQVVYNKAMEQ